MSGLLRDLRQTARLLAKSPGFLGVAVLLVALGVGASAALYSLVEAVLLHPVPAQRADRLYEMAGFASYADFLDLRRRGDVFAGVLAFDSSSMTMRRAGEAEKVGVGLVSDNYFAVLRAAMPLGRGFLPEEGVPGGPQVAVLGHALWKRRFASDPAVLGRVIDLDGAPFTVIGVAPPDFRGTRLADPLEVWIPLVADPGRSPGDLPELLSQRRSRWLVLVARLREGVPPGRAEAAARTLTERIAADLADDRGPIDVTLVPLAVAATGAESRRDFVRFLAFLGCVVGSVLLLTCANLANLLSVRALGRGKEMAVRSALGAPRTALLRQLLTESLLIALPGGLLAISVALLALRWTALFELPGEIGLGALRLGLDPGLVGFALGAALLTALVFGIAPAVHAFRPGLLRELTQQAGSPSRATGRLRATLIALQVALCFLLLAGGGLFTKSLRNAFHLDLGFASEELAAASLNLGLHDYDAPRAEAFYARLLERVRALPGVRGAALIHVLPLSGSRWRSNPRVDGQLLTGEEHEIYLNIVSPGFFETMGIPLRNGRTFSSRDRNGAPPVAVLNEAAARRLWPGREALGRRIDPLAHDAEVEIVGVVRDHIHHGLQAPPAPFLFVPFDQELGRTRITRTVHVVVRAADPGAVVAPLMGEIRALDAAVVPLAVDRFQDRIGALLLPQRFGVRLLGAFGALALLLSCVGIYSTVRYSVERRLREVGIRVALGARSVDILRLVLLQALAPVLAGVAVAVPMALAAGRLVSGFLFGIDAGDALNLAQVTALLLSVALLAAYLPARRASRLDVIASLKKD